MGAGGPSDPGKDVNEILGGEENTASSTKANDFGTTTGQAIAIKPIGNDASMSQMSQQRTADLNY